jgi:phospholipase/carboxylesterase
MRRERFGTLDAVVVDDGPARPDGLVCIFLHGFGAPGDDLVPMHDYFDAPPGTRWVFPAAPLELGGLYGDARAWWMIDLARLERDQLLGTPSDRSSEEPAELPAARAAMIALVDEVKARLGVTDDRIVLGGFSQGAMLSLDVALHLGRPLAGLILMSGTLIAEPVWTPRMQALRGLRVLQSHGQRDGLLPFPVAEKLRDLMKAAGLDVTWVPFRGQHEIPPPVVAAVGDFLRALAPG